MNSLTVEQQLIEQLIKDRNEQKERADRAEARIAELEDEGLARMQTGNNTIEEMNKQLDKAEAELEQLKALEDYPTFVHYIEGYRKRTVEMRKAQEEAKRLQMALDAMTKTLVDKEQEVAWLREALGWYAQPYVYTQAEFNHDIDDYMTLADYDKGKRARAALEGKDND